MKTQGTLWIVSAPSGGGKTSLVNALLRQDPQLTLSISHTTREPRVGETNGKNYFFVDETEFLEAVEAGVFLEHAKVFQHWYGTSKKWVISELAKGKDVILEIDWQGAERIREQLPCQSIFILPPTSEILEKRLKARQQDSETTIESRMAKAKAEMSHYSAYDFVVINDDFETALSDLEAIIAADRLREKRQSKSQAACINTLLRD